MTANRLSDDDQQRERPRGGRGGEDVLRLVRQRLSQTARVVRLGRPRRAASSGEPLVPSSCQPTRLD